MLFKPTNGSEGTFDDMNFVDTSNSEWHEFRDSVTSISFSPGVNTAENATGMLRDFAEVTDLDLNGLDTSNTTNMYSMFHGMTKLKALDLSRAANFDTSSVTNMGYMFRGLKSITELDLGKAANFDTSKVKIMNSMFRDLSSLTELDLSKAANFDTSKVTDMRAMFLFDEKLIELDLSKAANFDTSNVTDMSFMFSGLSGITELDLSRAANFDTSKVTDMSYMFSGLLGITELDLSKAANFDTSKVTDMRYMFKGLSELTELDLSKAANFDTSNVINMRAMFRDISKIKELDLSKAANFDTSSVTNMSFMFSGASKIRELDLSKAANFDTTNVTNMYAMFNLNSNLTSLNIGAPAIFDTSNVTDMAFMFSGLSNITELDLSRAANFDTSNVTDMRNMFREMSSLTELDLSKPANFDTSEVKRMSGMFREMNNLTELDLSRASNFDTSKATEMQAMFYADSNLTELDLSKAANFDTSKVTNFNAMFSGLSKIKELDLSKAANFDTSQATEMTLLFNKSDKIEKLVLPEHFNFLKLSGETVDKEIEESQGQDSPRLVTPTGADYTGKWIREDGTGNALTVSQLYDNPSNLEGAWIWQEKEKIQVNPQVHFNGGYNILPDEIQFKLYKNGEATDKVVTVNKSQIDENTGEVQLDFGEHYRYSDNDESQEIEYTIELVNPIDNISKLSNGNYLYTSPKTTYTEGIKQVGGKKQDVVVELLKNGVVVPGTEATIKSGSENTWNDLDETDESGNANTYDLAVSDQTQLAEGYELVADTDGNYSIVYTSPKLMLEITKTWVDGEDVRPDSITVIVKKDETELKELTLTKENNWRVELEVDKTDSDANEYKYSVEEKKVDGFNPEYSTDGLSITNTYVIPTKEVTAQVVFVGGKERPTVTVQLKDKDGNVIKEKEATIIDGKLVANFENIDSTDSRGNTKEYTVDLKSDVENYNKNVSEKVITLTYVSPKTEVDIPVNIPDEYSGDITIELIRDGKPTGKLVTVSADEIRKNGGKVKFTNLNKTDNDGKEYDYSEKTLTTIPGYEKSKDDKGNTVFTYTGSSEDMTINADFVGGSDLPRESIKIDIIRDGKVVKTVKVNKKDTVVEGLPKYDKAGNKINYSIKIANKNYLHSKGFNVRNIGSNKLKVEYVSPKADKTFKFLLQGSKNMPNVKVWLMRDGVKTGKFVILKPGQKEITFKNLDLTDANGKAYKYSADILDVPNGYNKVVSASGSTVILTKDKPDTAYLPYSGAKENFTIGIALAAIILYSRRNLRRNSANNKFKNASKRSFRK